MKPSSLSEQHARRASEESLTNYYEQLKDIMLAKNLLDKPKHIYNIDEKRINVEHTFQRMVVGRGCQPQVTMGERSKTVPVPLFFVFPGQRMLPELLDGKSSGAEGTVSASGLSNGDIFRTYLKEHFFKYIHKVVIQKTQF